ncbi:MAG: hypothetical protein R3C03_06585 [Pirellulaceae bacterium]
MVSESYRFPRIFLVLAILIACQPMIRGQSLPAYRDTATLYIPLYSWMARHGVMPTWNPYDNFGYSLAEDASSQLFYLPRIAMGTYAYDGDGIDWPTRFGLYLSFHILVSALAAFELARVMKASPWGACIAGLSYALGMPVLFQTTNVIFLAGAAWLPACLALAWSGLEKRDPWRCVGSGMFAALMVLGGDIEMAYVAMLIVGAMTVFSGIISRPFFSLGNVAQLKYSAIVAVVMLLCSFMQLWPSWQASKRSYRSFYVAPRNVWQVASETLITGESRFDFSGMVTRPTPGTHDDHIYQFSQPPWSIGEMFVPMISGSPFPTNTRWVDAISGQDRMWIPSLYQGCLIPLLLILGLGTVRSRATRMLWVMGGFFLVASWGWFGIGWLLKELHVVSADSQLSDPMGGLYWWMVSLLPAFDGFRYPAKLTIVASLAWATLAGVYASEICNVVKANRRILLFLILVAFLILANGVVQFNLFNSPSMSFAVAGEFDNAGFRIQLGLAVLSLSVVLFVTYLISQSRSNAANGRVLALFALLSIDVIVWNVSFLPWVKYDFVNLMPQINNGSFSTSTQLEHQIADAILKGEPKTHLLNDRWSDRSFTSIEGVGEVWYENCVRNDIQNRSKFYKAQKIVSANDDWISESIRTSRISAAWLKLDDRFLNSSDWGDNSNTNALGLLWNTTKNKTYRIELQAVSGTQFFDISSACDFQILPIVYSGDNYVANAEGKVLTTRPYANWLTVVDLRALKLPVVPVPLTIGVYQKPLLKRNYVWVSLISWSLLSTLMLMKATKLRRQRNNVQPACLSQDSDASDDSESPFV